jgi:hypothetical protein
MEGNCHIREGNCHIREGNCHIREGNCHIRDRTGVRLDGGLRVDRVTYPANRPENLHQFRDRLGHVSHAVLQVIGGISDLYSHAHRDQLGCNVSATSICSHQPSSDEHEYEGCDEEAVVDDARALFDPSSVARLHVIVLSLSSVVSSVVNSK